MLNELARAALQKALVADPAHPFTVLREAGAAAKRGAQEALSKGKWAEAWKCLEELEAVDQARQTLSNLGGQEALSGLRRRREAEAAKAAAAKVGASTPAEAAARA